MYCVLPRKGSRFGNWCNVAVEEYRPCSNVVLPEYPTMVSSKNRNDSERRVHMSVQLAPLSEFSLHLFN